MGMKTNLINLFKSVLFVLIGCLIILKVNKMFGISNEYSNHSKMMIQGFYDTEKDSVDMVAIGNSHVYRYWQSAFAWKEKGIATTAFSSSDMPCGAVKNVIAETLKTQSPKLIVIDATVFNNTNDKPSNKIYLLTNNMDYSANYFDMVNNFCDYADLSLADSMPYYLPIIQFHSRWYELGNNDFEQVQKSYLNSCYQENFLKTKVKDKKHKYTDERDEISPGSERALKDLLSWLKTQDVKVLFYVAPVLRGNAYLGRNNYIQDIVESEGFDFVDFNDEDYFTEFYFDTDNDFQDTNHTNVVGSYKFTMYMSDYLIANYGLEDKRGQDAYKSWDKKAKKYYDIVGEYLE